MKDKICGFPHSQCFRVRVCRCQTLWWEPKYSLYGHSINLLAFRGLEVPQARHEIWTTYKLFHDSFINVQMLSLWSIYIIFQSSSIMLECKYQENIINLTTMTFLPVSSCWKMLTNATNGSQQVTVRGKTSFPFPRFVWVLIAQES